MSTPELRDARASLHAIASSLRESHERMRAVTRVSQAPRKAESRRVRIERHPRALLVEDEDATARVFLRLLGEAFDVMRVATRAEALELIGMTHFDLAVLDLLLPDGNGASLVEPIRLASPTTRVVVITGVHVHAARADLREYGVDPGSVEIVTKTDAPVRLRLVKA